MMWWELKNSWVPLTSFLSTRLTNWPVTPSFIAEASRTLFNRKYTPSLMTLHSSRATRKKTTAQNTSAQLSFSFLNIFLLWMYNFRPQDDTAEKTRNSRRVLFRLWIWKCSSLCCVECGKASSKRSNFHRHIFWGAHYFLGHDFQTINEITGEKRWEIKAEVKFSSMHND